LLGDEFTSIAPALRVAVGIDLKFHTGWAFRYSFSETHKAAQWDWRGGSITCAKLATWGCIPVRTSKRSARHRTPGGRRVDFPKGFSSETEPAGVGVMKMSAVIDEESDSLIKINHGASLICIRLSRLRIS